MQPLNPESPTTCQPEGHYTMIPPCPHHFPESTLPTSLKGQLPLPGAPPLSTQGTDSEHPAQSEPVRYSLLGIFCILYYRIEKQMDGINEKNTAGKASVRAPCKRTMEQINCSAERQMEQSGGASREQWTHSPEGGTE